MARVTAVLVIHVPLPDQTGRKEGEAVPTEADQAGCKEGETVPTKQTREVPRRMRRSPLKKTREVPHPHDGTRVCLVRLPQCHHVTVAMATQCLCAIPPCNYSNGHSVHVCSWTRLMPHTHPSLATISSTHSLSVETHPSLAIILSTYSLIVSTGVDSGSRSCAAMARVSVTVS